MIAPSRDNPSPHDWPEDWADTEEDNGGYLHFCPECSAQFLGHKRRKGLCKVCARRHEDEAKRRVDLLVKGGLDPMEWELTLSSEHDKMMGELVRLVVEVGEERALRRKLAAALKVADSTNSSVAYWGEPHCHRQNSRSLHSEYSPYLCKICSSLFWPLCLPFRARYPGSLPLPYIRSRSFS